MVAKESEVVKTYMRSHGQFARNRDFHLSRGTELRIIMKA